MAPRFKLRIEVVVIHCFKELNCRGNFMTNLQICFRNLLKYNKANIIGDREDISQMCNTDRYLE